MPRLLAAEVHKLLTTRLWLWLLLASMAITALFAGLLIAFSDDPDTITLPLTMTAGQQTLLAVGAGAATPLAAVLGAITITGEYRHRTATPTFLATPRRWRVITAKFATSAMAGVAYGLACLAVTIAIAVPWLAGRRITLPLNDSSLLTTMSGVVVAVAVFATIGVGVGALVRDQVAATVSLLLYLFVLEPIITSIGAFDAWTPYLPGPARGALTQTDLTTRGFLDPWQGGAVLLAYAIGLVIIGTRIVARRDITG